MYSPPLHRKLLPWAYAALFFVVAPLLLFYTAGYRYNTKKATIEKYGTLIVDSSPSGATITLDGQVGIDTTPATFQELAPGWHRVRVERPGYAPWEKSLEIRAERAAFADRIHLFRSSPDIQLVHAGEVRALSSNRDRDTLFVLQKSPTMGSSTTALLLQSRGRVSSELSLPVSIPHEVDIRWQADDRAVYLDTPTSEDIVLRLTNRGLQATSTLGDAVWQGTDLIYSTSSQRIRWNSRNGETSREQLPTSTIAQLGNATIIEKDGARLLVLERTFSEQLLALPSGNWSFFDQQATHLLLRDKTRWLWIDQESDKPEAVLLEGTALRFPSDAAEPTSALLLHSNELLRWTPGQAPELLVRQSTAIREAAWHRSRDVVFFSTDTTIEALDLDERGGRRRQTLATFDRVHDFDLLGNTLYIAGERSGEQGVWMAIIE